MFEIKSRGSYYDIGLSYGKHLIAQKEIGFPPKFSEENIEKSKAYEKAVNDFCPGILDEFRGMAESCDVDYQTLIANECTPFRLKPQCLVFGIKGEYTKSGNPLLVRNHEWEEDEWKYLTICTVQPKGKLASYGFTFSWPLVSRYGGTNEAGLTLSGASTSFKNSGPGVIMNIAMRWILDSFKSTEEAVEFIEEIPKVWGTNYIIIDKNSTLAKIEAHREKTLVTYSENGFDMVSLTFEDPTMRKFTPDESLEIIELFETRKSFLNTWFSKNKGEITQDSIIKILQECDNKLHNHNYNEDGTKGKSWTCWSWIASPKLDEVLICPAAPCKNDFKPFKIDYLFS
ncbi:MAG: hypothetical protein FK733_08150 [Asgard group archaeon]|nr:hypothetical protein [Asgard group archaeon]